MRLLLAEDERDLAEALQALLEHYHYAVDVVHDGAAAFDMGLSDVYDALILDIMMPRKDGLEVLRDLRASGITTPVMMLTAKGRKDDRIAGFDAGADDYLPKPFAPDELLARLRALLRRRAGYTPQTISFGDVALDCGTSELSCTERPGRLEQLSRREFQILELLMTTPAKTFSAEEIRERVWGWESDVDTSVVWVHISNVRKRLQALGAQTTIKAMRGLGYRLVMQEPADRGENNPAVGSAEVDFADAKTGSGA